MENHSEESSTATVAKNKNAEASRRDLSSSPTLDVSAFDLLTESEAAARLRMSRSQLAKIRKSRGISFLNTSCIMYRERHLQEYLDNWGVSESLCI